MVIRPRSSLDCSERRTITRILDYLEVPSRYVGTDTLLAPNVFNDNPTDPVARRLVTTSRARPIRAIRCNRRSTKCRASATRAA